VVVLGPGGFVAWAVGSSGGSGGDVVSVNGSAVPQPQASPIAVRLANAIGRANLGPAQRRVDMTRIAPSRWDRVYVFSDETAVDIRRRLGFDWRNAPDAVPREGEHETLVTFVRGRRVASATFFSDAIGRLDCLTAPGGYPRGTRFVVRFSHAKPPVPYLATSRPRGAEAICLRAVGAG
jgi:hypothetical protein